MLLGARMALVVALVGPSALAAAKAVPVGLSCRGEEPFWRLEANRSNALLTRLGASEQVLKGELDDLGWLPPGWLVWRSTQAGQTPLVITLRAETCRSTMADEAPPGTHRAILVAGGDAAVTGCCTVTSALDPLIAPVTDPAAKPAEDWSRR